MTNRLFPKLFAICIVFVEAGCVDLNQPNSYPGTYDPYPSRYDTRYDDYRRRQDWERRRDAELRREREELRRERRELEEERKRDREDHHHTPPHSPLPRPTAHLQCPPGFSQSERKCTVEERRKGCKDIRMSNGLGCVRR